MRTTRNLLFGLTLSMLVLGIGCTSRRDAKTIPTKDAPPMPSEVRLDDGGHTLSSANLTAPGKYPL